MFPTYVSKQHLTVDATDKVFLYDGCLFSCLFKISNGSNKKKVIPEDDADIKKAKYFANSLNSCVAVLRQVPNQRLYFKNDPRLGQKGRTGDYLIAWTWHHFVKSRISQKSKL